MRTPICEIKNARVFRGMHQVFDDLNLTLFNGESTAILGPNGAGKTTLMRLLTREILPVVTDNSYIKLFGEEHINMNEHRQKIGIVSHDYQEQHLTLATGIEIVMSSFFGSVGLHANHNPTHEHKEKAKKIMRELDITHLETIQYLKLSTGQKRRLLLARALVHKPQALVFDEPTNGLDLHACFKLLSNMRDACNKNTTLIVITHHIQEIIPEIKRVICIKNGKIVDDGTKEELLTSQKISDLYETPTLIQNINGYYAAYPA